MVDRKTIIGFIDREHGPVGPIFAVVFVALMRNLGEMVLGRPVGNQTMDIVPSSLLVGLSQVLAFYALMYWLFTPLLAAALKRNHRQVAGAVSLGLIIGILPPVVDWIIHPGQSASYMFGTQPSWFFTGADFPVGETFAIWTAIVVTALFVLYVTGSVLRGALTLLGGYVIFQFVGIWLNIVLSVLFPDTSLPVTRLIYLALLFVIFVQVRVSSLRPSIDRINHALPLAIIALAGGLWVGDGWSEAIGKALVVLVATFVLLAHNDFYDRDSDLRGGRSPGTTADDAAWLWFLYATGILTVMLWSVVAALLLGVYLAAGALYHLPGPRLKHIFCVSYKIEGVWGATAFLFGALGSPASVQLPLESAILWPALFVFGGQALISGLKDYKDIQSDHEARVYTYYTLAVMNGRDPLVTHHRLVAVCATALLMAPALLWVKLGYHPLLPMTALLVLPPMAWIWLVPNRKRAVEGMFWLLCGYLFVLALAMKNLSPLDPIDTAIGTIIHVVDHGTGSVF